MNSTALTGALTPVHRKPVARPVGARAEAEASPISYRGVLTASVLWVLLGTALFFALNALLARDLSPSGSFAASFLAGGVGVLVTTRGLRKLPGYRTFLFLALSAYLLRVLVGVTLYVQTHDSDYFDGSGKYVDSNWEFRWTYQNVVNAADLMTKNGDLLKNRMMDARVDKNPFIHIWMGSFLAAGESRHALDLTPFNAFHHMVAAILIVGMALSCGYAPKVSLASGALVAWIPWAFPASLMWRDSVGFAWVVLALALLCIGKQSGIIGSLLLAIPAAFLAWADRASYLVAIAVIAGLSIVYDQQKSVKTGYLKGPRLAVVLLIMAGGVLLLSHSVGQMAFVGHQNQATESYASSRFILLPLLALRALAGPFPWFVGAKFELPVIFDYLFHVLQFAVFLMYVINWRSILSRVNILTYSAALFWVLAFVSGGVHTAYLAVAFPFVLPPVLNTGGSLGKNLLISSVCFLVGNLAYISLGLVGSGLVLGTTGY